MAGSLAGLTDGDLAKVLGLNAVKLFDLDLAAVNAIAAKVGPQKSSFKTAA
jgi:hypothetical protein